MSEEMIPSVIVPFANFSRIQTILCNKYIGIDGSDMYLASTSIDTTHENGAYSINFDSKDNNSYGPLTVSMKLHNRKETYDNWNLIIPGPFMQRIAIRKDKKKPEENIQTQVFIDRHKRLRDVIGNDALENAMNLRVMIWGCGRAGSLLALRMAQDGIGNRGGMILVDPDTVDHINLDGTMVFEAALDKPKALSVASMVSAFDSSAIIYPFVDSFSDETFDAVVSADVIFIAVDNDETRGNIIRTATRYHKVVIDISSGATMNNNNIVVGHNASMFIPGRAGCPMCHLSRKTTETAIQNIINISSDEFADKNKRPNDRFTHSDEICASVADGLHLFWGIVLGKIQTTMYINGEYDYNRCVRTSTTSAPETRRTCLFCNDRLSGIPIE